MAIGEDGDALLLRTWRASHDWKERPPLDASMRSLHSVWNYQPVGRFYQES